jgi:hypothetical protein
MAVFCAICTELAYIGASPVCSGYINRVIHRICGQVAAGPVDTDSCISSAACPLWPTAGVGITLKR